MNVLAQQAAAAAAAAVQKPVADAAQVLTAEMNSGREMVDVALKWLAENGASFVVNVLVAVLLLLLGSHVIRLMTRATHKALLKTGRVNTLLQNFLCSVVNKVGWVLLAMVVVQRLGVNIAPLIAGLGVTGFILGFAFQETLGNLASGMMIAINQPFKVGDYVALGSGGIEGAVLELNMMAATLATGDNKKVVVPNKVVWGSAITNYTALDKRRVDMTISIAYGAEIGKAKRIALEVMRTHPLVLADPAPIAEVLSMGDSAVNLALRPWAKPTDYWTVLFAVNQAVKEAFETNGVEIPFPQLEVRMKS
jgi:small conductance mechanosensitive channel